MKGKKKMLSWTKIAQKQLDADQEIHIKVHRGCLDKQMKNLLFLANMQ